MYNSEYLYVNSLSLDNELKKVVWTMMVQKKLDKYSYETQYETPYTIFSYTNNKRRLSALPRIAGIKKKTGFDLGIDVLHPLIESDYWKLCIQRAIHLRLTLRIRSCLRERNYNRARL